MNNNEWLQEVDFKLNISNVLLRKKPLLLFKNLQYINRCLFFDTLNTISYRQGLIVV